MPEEPELSFENAVGQLEAIVEALEAGEPSLAAALAKYETGAQLLARCYNMLERAERSVAVLTGIDADGNPTIEPFDATATLEADQDRRAGGAAEAKAEPAPILKTTRSRRPRPVAETETDRLDPPF
jgi:exodeoxyribonuclease VII small subunit